MTILCSVVSPWYRLGMMHPESRIGNVLRNGSLHRRILLPLLAVLWLVVPVKSPFGAGDTPLSTPALRGDVAKKLEVFLDRFVTFAPGRKITFQRDGRPCPTGFMLIRYSIKSATPAFDRTSALLLSDDGKSVFAGHAISLAENATDIRDARGPEKLSLYFSQKAGSTMKVSWGSSPGPGGAFQAKILAASPVGDVESPGALSRDGKWFLFGTFFPLNQDPRCERMSRLALEGRVALGRQNAPVTVVEISDFQCSSCAELQPVLEALLSKYASQIRLVRVDLPQWQAHDWAMKAAEWGHCVGQIAPSAYWSFTRAVFLRQRDVTSANFDSLMNPVIQSLGLQPRGFDECCRRGSTNEAVLKDLKRVAAAGLSGTPTLLVNGMLLDTNVGEVLEPALIQVLKGQPRCAEKSAQRKEGL